MFQKSDTLITVSLKENIEVFTLNHVNHISDRNHTSDRSRHGEFTGTAKVSAS